MFGANFALGLPSWLRIPVTPKALEDRFVIFRGKLTVLTKFVSVLFSLAGSITTSLTTSALRVSFVDGFVGSLECT